MFNVTEKLKVYRLFQDKIHYCLLQLNVLVWKAFTIFLQPLRCVDPLFSFELLSSKSITLHWNTALQIMRSFPNIPLSKSILYQIRNQNVQYLERLYLSESLWRTHFWKWSCFAKKNSFGCLIVMVNIDVLRMYFKVTTCFLVPLIETLQLFIMNIHMDNCGLKFLLLQVNERNPVESAKGSLTLNSLAAL